MKVLQINTTLNSGSTGRIAEDIGIVARNAGYKSIVAAAYTNRSSKSEVISIGTKIDRILHGLKTRFFDRHGFGSALATNGLIKKIREIKPDIIHLHNIHGYYINIRILFNFLKKSQLPVVWTFHDCWPFTGHCAYFDRYNCLKWQSVCFHCPAKNGYPASWLIDNSRKNFVDKNKLFTGLNTLQIITPSNWLADHVKKSFLKDKPVRCIHNGIDLDAFNIIANEQEIINKYKLSHKLILLGVASNWDKRKGLDDFIRLSTFIRKNEQIVLVGLKKEQIIELPKNITGIERTESTTELAAMYSIATVFINPTYVDNFPTTNIEALACGTPVISYNTGGSPEAINQETGFIIEKGDIKGLLKAITHIVEKGKKHYQPLCRARAEKYFDKKDRFGEYLDLYREILKFK